MRRSPCAHISAAMLPYIAHFRCHSVLLMGLEGESRCVIDPARSLRRILPASQPGQVRVSSCNNHTHSLTYLQSRQRISSDIHLTSEQHSKLQPPCSPSPVLITKPPLRPWRRVRQRPPVAALAATASAMAQLQLQWAPLPLTLQQHQPRRSIQCRPRWSVRPSVASSSTGCQRLCTSGTSSTAHSPSQRWA